MADDIVDSLETYCLCSHVDYPWYYGVGSSCPLCKARAEIERLRGLIKDYVESSLAEWTDAWFASDDLGEKADQAFEALREEARRV